MIKFKITDSHIKLARKMYVGWSDVEFGAPEIDPKRPYGNSDVTNDIAEILGLPIEEEMPEALVDYLHSLHKSMETALQIFLCTGKFETGEYENDDYGLNWKKVR